MFKSIQIRVMLMIILLAIIMFLAGGMFFINILENISQETIDIQVTQAKIIVAVITITFIAISILIVVFTSEIIISPISKLIKNAKKFAK